MRQFASSGFRIWNLSREAKVIYTGFGLFALLALLVSMLFYEDLVGGSSGVKGYYAGETAHATEESAPPRTKIEIPDEPQRLVVAVTYRKLLEVTHFHLFTVPVFLLIIAHLFMLTGLRAGTKVAWIVSGWISTLVHLGAPWLIRYGTPRLAWLYGTSGALMGVTMTVLTVYPMIVMWRGRRSADEAA